VTQPRRPWAAALAAALALGACGEDRSGSTSTETTPAPAAPAPPPPRVESPRAKVTVAEGDYRLEPARIRVNRPATLEIKVRNTGAVRHALTVDAPAGEAETKPLEPGATTMLRVELDRPGRYRWYCPIGDHAKRGMRGSISVARG